MILSFGSGPAAANSALVLGLPSLIAVAGYAAAAALRGVHGTQLPRIALLVAWLAHGLAVIADAAGWASADRGVRFGFATAISATAWLVIAVYAIESRFVPVFNAHRGVAMFGVAAVVLAWAFPAEIRSHSMSPWVPLHWVLGIASYGLFGAAVLHAAMLNRAERLMRNKVMPAQPQGVPLLQLERLTFRFVSAGFVILSAALLLGMWFANPWRWDHKTVFSLLGWMVFAGLLAGRRVFGWRGRRATGWLYAGAGLLILAYVGSRFVLEVLLHRTSAA
jgi:ABC-type uncharacterized transport system permease subunit